MICKILFALINVVQNRFLFIVVFFLYHQNWVTNDHDKVNTCFTVKAKLGSTAAGRASY